MYTLPEMDENPDQPPDTIHPMVLTQPITGRKGLSLDLLRTYAIEGLLQVESRTLAPKTYRPYYTTGAHF